MPFGQNQPIKAIATGIDPQITAQGEKIDQISMIEVAIADQNGQTESRASGIPSPQVRPDDTCHQKLPAIRAQACSGRKILNIVRQRISRANDRDAPEVVWWRG